MLFDYTSKIHISLNNITITEFAKKEMIKELQYNFMIQKYFFLSLLFLFWIFFVFHQFKQKKGKNKGIKPLVK